MKRAYHDLMEQISVPSGLNDRVLQTIRQEAAGVGTRWKRTALRAAVCAACALALVLGTVRLAPRSAEEPGLPQLTYSFGLTAYAADIGETIVPNANGGLALHSGTGIWDPLQGYFTGCLFQVTGENLQKVTLSVDRGGLYRSETRKALSNDETQALWQAEENGELVCSVYGADEGAPMNADVMTALGSNITVDYDPSASYGFWVPPEELPTASDDMKQDTWDSIDTFDGVHLTVEATFLDGKQKVGPTPSPPAVCGWIGMKTGHGRSCPSWLGTRRRTFTAFMPSAKRRAAGFNGRWRAAIPSASATPSEPDGIPADRGKPSTMGSTFQPNGEPRCWRLRTAP